MLSDTNAEIPFGVHDREHHRLGEGAVERGKRGVCVCGGGEANKTLVFEPHLPDFKAK